MDQRHNKCAAVVSSFSFRPLTHVGTFGHEVPGYPNFPSYTLDVVSAELPCGVSWLASMLLECGVPIWNPWNIDMSLEWRHMGERQFEYDYPGDPWSRVIPGLVSGRRFNFCESVVPRFSHDVPGHWTPSKRVILFVRDPRDALFSAWRRLQRASSSLQPFNAWVGQTDPLWGVSRAAAYLMHLTTWRYFAASLQVEMLVIRFEDVKADARQEFQRILEFIDEAAFDPTPQEIDHVLRVSSFGALKAIEEKMISNGVFNTRVNIAGRAYEYKQHFDEHMHAAVGSGGCKVYQWLGYDPPRAKSTHNGAPRVRPDWFIDVRGDLLEATTQAVDDAMTLYEQDF
jgi:hypothetical protein